jgi:hypothetical protein
MNMTGKKTVSLLLLLGVWLGVAVGPAAADFVGQTNAQVEKVANPILDAVLQGFSEGNYGLYSKYFDDTLKDVITKKKFMQVRKKILGNIGKCQSRSYLGFLQQGKTTVVLWKGKFSRTNDDILIKLVLSRRGDQIKVLGLWFQ